MCLPIAALGTTALGTAKLALAGVSAVSSIASASAEQKAGMARYNQNKQAAEDAYILETQLMNKRMNEEQAALSQNKQDNRVKQMMASSTALVNAAAGGVQGLSVEQALTDFKRNEGIVTDRLNQSFEAKQEQARFEVMGLQSKARDRVNSVPIPGMGNLFTSVVRGGGAVFDAVSEYTNLFDGDLDG